MGEKKQYWMRSRLDIRVFHWYKEIVSYLSTAGGEASRRNTLHVGGHRGMERKKNVRMDHLDTRQKVLETHFSQPSKCRWHILSSYVVILDCFKNITVYILLMCTRENVYVWIGELFEMGTRKIIFYTCMHVHTCACVYTNMYTHLWNDART